MTYGVGWRLLGLPDDCRVPDRLKELSPPFGKKQAGRVTSAAPVVAGADM